MWSQLLLGSLSRMQGDKQNSQEVTSALTSLPRRKHYQRLVEARTRWRVKSSGYVCCG